MALPVEADVVRCGVGGSCGGMPLGRTAESWPDSGPGEAAVFGINVGSALAGRTVVAPKVVLMVRMYGTTPLDGPRLASAIQR